MPRKPHAGRWLVALVVILLLRAGGVWTYRQYGLTLPPLDVRQRAAITIVTIIIGGKMALKGLLGKEFKLHEQGPETSLLLPCQPLQIIFSRASHTPGIGLRSRALR
jgi:hypothetical protein